MKKKEARDSILYARVSKKNLAFLKKAAKDLDYSVSEFLDLYINEMRGGTYDRKQKQFSGGP